MNTMRRHRRATAGFTLVEMMVVIIIMALLLAWALPSYKNLITTYRMSDELSQLQTDVELARSSAVRTGSNVTICPANVASSSTSSTPACNGANEWNTGWIVFTDNADDQTVDPGDTVLREHIGMTGGDTLVSEVTSSTTAVNTITFNSMGGTTAWGSATAAPTGSIVLNDSGNDASMTRCLTISVAGMIQVTSPQTESQTPAPPTCP
jgi:type IV fimbrial biogenesis protein FimT